jgi:hypothetical protein
VMPRTQPRRSQRHSTLDSFRPLRYSLLFRLARAHSCQQHLPKSRMSLHCSTGFPDLRPRFQMESHHRRSLVGHQGSRVARQRRSSFSEVSIPHFQGAPPIQLAWAARHLSQR